MRELLILLRTRISSPDCNTDKQLLSHPKQTSKSTILQGPLSWIVWANLIAVYVAWGSTYLAIRFAIETMPPFFMAAFRFLFSGAVLYLWRRASGDIPPSRIEWRSATIIGILLLVGGNGGVVWAEQRVASGLASLVVATTPLSMVLMEMLRPSGRSAGMACGRWHSDWFFRNYRLAGTISCGRQRREPGSDRGGGFVCRLAMLVHRLALQSQRPIAVFSPLGTGMEMLTGGAGLLLLGSLPGNGAV